MMKLYIQKDILEYEKNGYNFVNEEYGAENDPYGTEMLIYKTD